jgi:integrase/recombinase XerC
MAALLREQRDRVIDHAEERTGIWADHDLVFPGATGRPRGADAVRDQLAALCNEAKVPVLTPHGLRHTFATNLSEHAPVSVVRDVLGHSTLMITDGYLHASTEAQVEAEARFKLWLRKARL